MTDSANETTPLLANENGNQPRRRPLPRLPISIAVLLRLSDGLATATIAPFINQLVSELDVTGGDKRKVGYYVGLIATSYGIASGVSAFQWNQISDRVGRKPVALIGMLGAAVSMITFGLSQTFSGLIASRCLWGLLDGSVGVARSIVGEVTDSTNQVKAFGLITLAASVASAVAPLIGGTLANPSERFPAFNDQFWKSYPYFLPCLATAGFIFLAFLFTLFFFRESALSSSRSSGQNHHKPLPLRELLTYPVLISAANYTSLMFLFLCHIALFPLFLAMPITIGGLGYEPLQIGYIMSLKTTLTAIVLALFIDPLVRRFGERPLFVYAVAGHLVLWVLYPALNAYAKYHGKSNAIVWLGIGAMALLTSSAQLGFSCIYAIIVEAAPNKRSLGATNGVSQTAATVARVVAPAFATSMFSWSVERGFLGGYAVYVVLFVLSCLGVLLAHRLLRKEEEKLSPRQ